MFFFRGYSVSSQFFRPKIAMNPYLLSRFRQEKGLRLKDQILKSLQWLMTCSANALVFLGVKCLKDEILNGDKPRGLGFTRTGKGTRGKRVYSKMVVMGFWVFFMGGQNRKGLFITLVFSSFIK